MPATRATLKAKRLQLHPRHKVGTNSRPPHRPTNNRPLVDTDRVRRVDTGAHNPLLHLPHRVTAATINRRVNKVEDMVVVEVVREVTVETVEVVAVVGTVAEVMTTTVTAAVGTADEVVVVATVVDVVGIEEAAGVVHK